MADEEKKEGDPVGHVVGAVVGGTLAGTVGAAAVGTALGVIGVVTAPAWIVPALAAGGAYAGYKWMKGK